MGILDLNSELEGIKTLCSQAQTAVDAAERDDLEKFIEIVSTYTDQFDKWDERFKTLTPFGDSSNLNMDEQRQLQEQLVELNSLHLLVLNYASRYREGVGQEMGSFHKRIKGIKQYTAPSSAPISITGKRKG